jgi:hypothetical protein
MRQIIAALAASALLFGATPALAGGHGHRGHHGHGRHGDEAAYLVGGLLGGLMLGSLLTRASTPPPPRHYAPPQPVLGGCRPTTGTKYLNGRPAQFGGTMCYDSYGNAYILRGSEHFIGYLR